MARSTAWGAVMAAAVPAALTLGAAASGDVATNARPGDFVANSNWDHAVPVGQGASCQLDDGASTNAIGLTDDGVIGWAQRFDSACADTIENIATTYSVADNADAGVSPGDPVGYAILEDTGSGPGNVIYQDQGTVDGAAINTNTFQSLPVDPSQSVSGSFYLAVWVEDGANTYPAPMDEESAPADAEDVYLIYEIGGTFGTFDPGNPATSTTMASVDLPTAWMLRGNEGGLPPGSSCQYDDGASTNALGLTDGGVIGWAQRYDTTCADTIENIATTYGKADSSTAGVSPGDPVGYAIMTDSGSGPGSVIYQDQSTVDGAAINTNTFQLLPVDPPQSVGGSFYLVVWVQNAANRFPAPMDADSAKGHADDVWAISTLGGTFGGFDPENPGSVVNMADAGLPRVWMLRGNESGELPPGACCLDGAACPEDLTGDGEVGGADLGTLLSAWGPCDDPNDCPEDLTGDGNVGGADLGTLLSAWGPCDEGGGGCQIVDDEAACNDLGGEWAGSGTNCEDNCPIEGACCDGENCTITSPNECDAIGGTYQGNFTECDPNPCLEEGCGSPDAGDCCVANGTPFCEDEACCDLICGQDPFCCDTSWDGICADAANDQCEVCQ